MIFVIGGETASGKTNLAFRLAKKINGIIINGDAFAFYRELNIGTAKPSAKELASVETFLFNNISVNDTYSIYDYQQDGRKVIDEYLKRNVPIIIVGGSGLYIRALLYDYKLQAAHGEIIDDETISNAELYEKLKVVDCDAAAKIHPNNRKRVLRALAIHQSQNTKKSALDAQTSALPLYPYVMVVLTSEETQREARINKRTTEMFAQGLKEEALTLGANYDPHLQALQAIGYKEIIANSSATDDELIALISLRTRQLAKRQRTFFKHQFTSLWFTNADEAYTYLSRKYEEMI